MPQKLEKQSLLPGPNNRRNRPYDSTCVEYKPDKIYWEFFKDYFWHFGFLGSPLSFAFWMDFVYTEVLVKFYN